MLHAFASYTVSHDAKVCARMCCSGFDSCKAACHQHSHRLVHWRCHIRSTLLLSHFAIIIMAKNIQGGRMSATRFGVSRNGCAQGIRPSSYSILLHGCVPQNAVMCFGGGAPLPATLHCFILFDEDLVRWEGGSKNMVWTATPVSTCIPRSNSTTLPSMTCLKVIYK